MMKERKIIQIAALAPAEGAYGGLIYALCNDGSLWCGATHQKHERWERCDEIPQPWGKGDEEGPDDPPESH